jgi:hypothetical protein
MMAWLSNGKVYCRFALTVEVFRKGDLVDFSLGIVKCGLPNWLIQRVKERFPNAGFHKRLIQLELRWVSRHPLNPLPILKW